MIKIKITPLNIEFLAKPNSNLMEFLAENGINLINNCGFRGACKKCTIKLLKGYLPKEALLEDNIYLGCKSVLSEDIEIELINYNLSSDFKINKKFDFVCEKINPQIIDELIDFNAVEEVENSYYENILSCFDGFKVDSIDFIRKLPVFLKKYNNQIKVIKDVQAGLFLDIVKNDSSMYGIIVDIGTTTVNLALVDIKTGVIVDSASAYNSQISYGTDIISRIIYSQKENGLENLYNAVLETINGLIDKICSLNNIDFEYIYQAVIAGNTTMMHLFFNVPPDSIRIEPYKPVFLKFNPSIKDLDLKMNNNGKIYCFESFGSYVGGDITSGILASKIYQNDDISLFIDIGTNGEIVLGNSDWLISCACSAGPAFEGAGVKCGTRAIDGAIDKVIIDKSTLKPEISTINNKLPIGICGSAMIDIVAEMYRAGIIDRQGKFLISNEFIKDDKYVLANVENTSISEDIFINQSDIQNIIRTKGAIFAGIYSLLDYAGINIEDISKVYIAGGLGESIDFKNAVFIGLFPDLSQEKYEYIGNASLNGCYLRLMNYEEDNHIKKISEIMNYFDISQDVEYMNRFMASLFIPHTDLSLFSSLKD